VNFTNAKDVISYLYSLPKLHPKGDLSYVKRALDVLDNPQNKVKTIHVTGTNGKGSTSYYISNLLRKAGQKTGLFVSPYVFEFNERIQLNGKNISNSDLVKVANQVEKAITKIKRNDPDFSLVTFEYETVMAFTFFAEQKCDYAVIEVGIGGEHDKTNVITPEVSVITTVGLDHEKIIGPTIQDIAHEKSGIIKSHRPVIGGNIPKTILPIIEKKAAQEHAPFYLLGRNFIVSDDKRVVYKVKNKTLSFISHPKVESYDIAVAVQVFSLLHLPLSNALIEQAVNQTKIPGRYQLLKENPMIILDGAHNIQAVKNLLEFVHKQKKIRDGQVRVLITMMKDKDLEQVFSLFDKADRLLLTTISYPRVAKKADFPVAVQKKYPYEANWEKAFDELKDASEDNDILLVTGSFYLVSEILNMGEANASSGY
jgi:dihydrofolate synthase/folylpolyglutamate synthase